MATEGNYTEMQLVSRAAKEEDFELFYQSAYTTFGYDQSPRANVLREWGVFRSNPHALSVVVEDLDRRAGEQFVGYTEGVFVSSRFVEWAKTGEAPYLNLQIANNMPDGKSPVLTSDQIAAANSGEGICLYIAYSGWCEPPLTSEEAYFVRTFMDTAFRK